MSVTNDSVECVINDNLNDCVFSELQLCGFRRGLNLFQFEITFFNYSSCIKQLPRVLFIINTNYCSGFIKWRGNQLHKTRRNLLELL